jgi:hypothetical protein
MYEKMLDPTFVEYKVRPITRYVVTRFWRSPEGSGGEQKGEYDNADMAYEVGYALAKAEHDQLGWPLTDERIQYPRHPHAGDSAKAA